MANDFVTIADMVADAYDLAPFELTEIREAAPVLSRLPAIPSSNGDTHKYAVWVSNPVVGFRAENAGRDFDKSEDRIDTVTLKILDFSWMADKAVADRWRQGGAATYVAREGIRHIASAMWKLEQQFLNGTVDGDATGFSGLADSAYLDDSDDDQVENAGGTTAATASSCYLLRVSPSECSMVMHNSGIELGDTIVTNFVDGSNKNLPVYYTPGCAWTACQLGAKYSVVRIANITEDSGKGLTDDLLYKALKRFPSGMGPNLVVTNQRSLEQLRSNRTATNGTGQPAPRPTTVLEGIPIITTDALTETEALLTVA